MNNIIVHNVAAPIPDMRGLAQLWAVAGLFWYNIMKKDTLLLKVLYAKYWYSLSNIDAQKSSHYVSIYSYLALICLSLVQLQKHRLCGSLPCVPSASHNRSARDAAWQKRYNFSRTDAFKSIFEKIVVLLIKHIQMWNNCKMYNIKAHFAILLFSFSLFSFKLKHCAFPAQCSQAAGA